MSDMTDQAPVDLDSAEATEQTEPTEADAEQSGGGNREAAKYRRQLRATETRLEVAQAVVAEMNRETAERLASERLADPSDLWNAAELDGLLDTSGKLDAASVEVAVAELLNRKPHLALRGPGAPAASTVTGDGKAPAPKGSQSWAEALRGSP